MLVWKDLSPFLIKLTTEKSPHDPFIFSQSESSDRQERDSDRARNENTDSEDNTNLEIKDLEIKAFINDKNFEKNLKNIFYLFREIWKRKLR